MGQILLDAGAPPGVGNVIPTSDLADIVEPPLADSRVRKLSFTGSTAVGRRLASLASDQLLRLSLELGGNAPFIVFEDADMELALRGELIAKLRNGGAACTAANRFYVHESLAAEFTKRLSESFRALKIGRGTDKTVDLAPLVNNAQRGRVTRLVADAIQAGATFSNRRCGP